MASPVVEARASGATSASNTTSHSITLPGSIAAGELLLVTFSVDGDPTVSINTGASGSNWKILGQASNSTVVTGAIVWKIAEGSDALTLTTSATEQSSHVSHRISNAGPPMGTSANGSSTNSDPPNEDAFVSDDYVWIATRSGDSTTNATVAPTNFGNLTTINAAGTGGASTATAERTTTASSQDPGTFTSASEQWVSWTISVPPKLTLGQRVLDDFSDGTISSAWANTGDGSSAETSGVLRLSVTNGQYAGVKQTLWHDEVYRGARVVDAGDQAGIASLEVYPAFVSTSSADQAFWYLNANALSCSHRVATTLTTARTFTYNSAVHKYFAIGETGGTIYWLWSPDGSTWRRAFSRADWFATTLWTIELFTGIFGVGTDTVDFDDFSVWASSTVAGAPANTRRLALRHLLVR